MSQIVQFKVIKDGKIAFSYSIPYTLLGTVGIVDVTTQFRASTLFFQSVAEAVAAGQFDCCDMNKLFAEYLAVPFVINPLCSYIPVLNIPGATGASTTVAGQTVSGIPAGSFVFVSSLKDGLLINYNTVFISNIGQSTSGTSTTFTADGSTYSGTIFIQGKKVTILQSFQIQDDPDFIYTNNNPNNYNFTLFPIKDESSDAKASHAVSPAEIKASLDVVRSYLYKISTQTLTLKEVKRLIRKQFEHWKTDGQWVIFPRMGEGVQYVVGFVGKILTTEGWMNLNFNLKIYFGSPLLEFNMTVTKVPIYLGPLIYVTDVGNTSTLVSGLPVRPTFRSRQPITSCPDVSCWITISPASAVSTNVTEKKNGNFVFILTDRATISLHGTPNDRSVVRPKGFQVVVSGSNLAAGEGQCFGDTTTNVYVYNTDDSCNLSFIINFTANSIATATGLSIGVVILIIFAIAVSIGPVAGIA